MQPPYYNQIKEPAPFHDAGDRVSSANADFNSKYQTSDSRRYGRSHDMIGSNHVPTLPPPPPSSNRNQSMAADQSEDCTRYNKFHDIKTNLNTTNAERQSQSQLQSSSYSGKNSKDQDPYRTLSALNENSKSHISISALPKIPKIKNSASALRTSKHTERSHSPLVNLKSESSKSPKFSSVAHDDSSMHSYDMQPNYKRYPPNQSAILNGRNQDYGDHSSTAMDNNSNSSSVNIIEPEMYVNKKLNF